MLAAAARLAGESDRIYFGPERQKQFPAGREAELSRLALEAGTKDTPEIAPNFRGGEHDVWIDDPPETVLKHTLPGFFGRIMDEAALLDPRTFLSRRKLTMRGALPSEYLRRWPVLHDIFGLPTM